MILPKFISRSFRPTVQNGRGWLRNFKRTMSGAKNEQSIKFDPLQGATKSTKSVGPSPVEIPLEALPLNMRFYRWWKTGLGRKVVLATFITGSGLCIAQSWGRNSFLMKYVKEFYQLYQSGVPAKLDTHTKTNILPEVFQDMKLSQEQRENLNVFLLNNTEPFSWGELKNKAMLGLPFWFKFNSLAEVPLDAFNYGRRGTTVVKNLSDEERSSEHARNLAEGMVISDNAKKFTIAREIVKVRDLQPHIVEGTLGAVCIMMCHTFARTVNDTMKLFKRPPLVRAANYMFALNGSILIYFTTKDLLNRMYQGRMDQGAASISREYAEGGVEFYTKQMQRNAAQRELVLGADKKYNMKGEEVYGILRFRNKLLTERRQICQEKLNSFTS